MYFEHGTIVFSPSDLTRFMESPFASWMERLHREFPDRVTPDERNDELQLYADAGITHEAAFVKELETQGRELCWIQGTTGNKRQRRLSRPCLRDVRLFFRHT